VNSDTTTVVTITVIIVGSVGLAWLFYEWLSERVRKDADKTQEGPALPPKSPQDAPKPKDLDNP